MEMREEFEARDERMVDARSRIGIRAVVAATVVALAVELLLVVIGAAAGMSAMLPSGRAGRGLGTGFGAWIIGSLCVSAYVGAWFASNAARAASSGEGLLHGFLIWAMVALVSTSLIGSTLSANLSAVIGALGGTSETALSQPPTVEQAIKVTAVGLWWFVAGLALPLVFALIGGRAGVGPVDERGRALRDRDLLAPRRRRVYTTSASPPPPAPEPFPPGPTMPPEPRPV